MKRTWIAGLMMILLANSISGCKHTEDMDVWASVPSETESVVTETPAPTEESTPTPDGEKKIEVTLSNSQDLMADYTTMKEIPAEPGTYIAVVAKGLDSAYWKRVKEGAVAAIDELNSILGYKGEDKIRITFEGPGDTADVDKQINTIDEVLAENPSVLCLSAIDMHSCDAQLETAADNGIPVVIIDSGVQSDMTATACATNNYAAGAEAAQKLCEAIGDSGEIAVMAHQRTAQSSIDRIKGFTEEIKKNHPDVKIAQIAYENEKETVENMVASVLRSHPDLAGYFCTNGNMSNQTLEALEEADNTAVKVVGFDAGKIQQNAVKGGRQYGMICQNPYGMGYASMAAAARLAAHLPTDSYISSGYQWIDQSNIDLPENRKYLYE